MVAMLVLMALTCFARESPDWSTNRLAVELLDETADKGQVLRLYDELLSERAPVSYDMSDEKFRQIIQYRRNNNQYTLLFYEKNASPLATERTLVGSVSVVFEYKFIRGGVIKGFVEDVVTTKSCRNMGYGKEMLHFLILLFSRAHKDCYKMELSCDENKFKVYNSVGFEMSEIAMEYRTAKNKDMLEELRDSNTMEMPLRLRVPEPTN
ncbi:glucosamine-phosphate N-acetyltransferase [Pancytospora philotis]|nr:glucosamine-phosphate N-acetyltransferase [Pancytospora philotis]